MPVPKQADPDIRRTLIRAVAVPLAFALLLAAILLGEILYLLSLQRWVAHTDRVLEETYELQRTLADHEAGLRGYLLTADEAFLEPYLVALPLTPPAMDELEQLVSEKPEAVDHVRRTRQHYEQWLEFAEEAITRLRQGKDITALVSSGRGKLRMDAMRAQLTALLALEQRLRSERVARSTAAAWVVLGSAGGLILLLGLVLALVTRRRLGEVAGTYSQSLTTVEQQTEALRASEERYRRLAELSPDGIIVQTRGIIRYANHAIASILRVADPQDLIGRPVVELIHPAYHEAVRERVRQIVEESRDVPLLEERFLRSDGSEVWVEVTAAPFRFDGEAGAQVIVRDISERIAAREARRRLEAERAAALVVLQRSEESLAKAQQIAHLGSWELHIETGEATWSDEMYRIFGQSRESFRPTRQAIQAFIHPEDQDAVMHAADESIQHDAAFNIDHRVVRPDGVVRFVNSQGEVVRDESGKAVRFIGTMLDITDRKLAEEQLRQLNETLEQRVAERTAELREANEDLEAFNYTISHDLRTPMRTMRGFAQAMLEDYGEKLDETGRDYARRIVAAAARMDRLTQELLEYSQLSRRKLVSQRISPVLVLHDVLGQLERDPQFARARVDIADPMPWVLAHRPTLAAVFSNLLDNAAKFVAPGVTPVIAIRGESRGDKARIWVMDNGIGIAPEHHEQIFNVFERLHGMERFGGTGIGLAIVRRGVERMGGRVGLESAVGRGSQFWIELPRDPASL